MFRRRKIVLLLAIVGASCSFTAAFWGPTNLLLLFVMAECVVAFSAAIYPIAVALVNDKLHHHQIVAASAGLLLSHGLGSCFGPILGSAAISIVGPDGLFLFIGAMLVFLTLFTIWRIMAGKWVPVSEQEAFVTSHPISDVTILNDLDPRNDQFLARKHPTDTSDDDDPPAQGR